MLSFQPSESLYRIRSLLPPQPPHRILHIIFTGHLFNKPFKNESLFQVNILQEHIEYLLHITVLHVGFYLSSLKPIREYHYPHITDWDAGSEVQGLAEYQLQLVDSTRTHQTPKLLILSLHPVHFGWPHSVQKPSKLTCAHHLS